MHSPWMYQVAVTLFMAIIMLTDVATSELLMADDDRLALNKNDIALLKNTCNECITLDILSIPESVINIICYIF